MPEMTPLLSAIMHKEDITLLRTLLIQRQIRRDPRHHQKEDANCGEMNEKEKQKDLVTIKSGRTEGSIVVRNSLL